jgi:hypothetical protein
VGVHYVKGDLVKNPMIDPEHPEALVYAPDAHGGLHLAALEYVVIKSDWDAHNLPVGSGAPSWVKPAPPNLFGQDFNFTDTPNRYGLPPFYSLHAGSGKATRPEPPRCGIPACTVTRQHSAVSDENLGLESSGQEKCGQVAVLSRFRVQFIRTSCLLSGQNQLSGRIRRAIAKLS